MSACAGFHLHLYQPPRESPWLGVVEGEWSAWPYHDWNERVAAECYRAIVAVALPVPGGGVELAEPLTASSFDVGPTLHHWFEAHARDVETALTHEARVHGPASRVAIAAPLVHAILPLAHPDDARRLIAWGIADYRKRYGVDPAGFWLPETAVDLATLELLVDAGVTYTVLMPGQAARVRAPHAAWADVTDESLDTSRPYLVRLASGRTISVVFGHRDLSRGVAFGDLLGDGERLADQMTEAAGGGLALVVADAETYGHHHRFGELGLAWAQRSLEDAGVTTAVGEWLTTHPPTWEAELKPVSSWSCAHGVERWRSACGDVTGEQPGYSLDWRAPLREAMDWLRAEAVAGLEAALAPLVTSVDETLAGYGAVLCGALSPKDFVAAHQSKTHHAERVAQVLELCEAYRHVLYSFTSCGWFFADPGEIETGIVLRFAARAVELLASAAGVDLAAELASRLAGVHSNLHRVSGEALIERAVAPTRVTPEQIAAGGAAEAHARRGSARTRRGAWRVVVEGAGAGCYRVAVEDTRTTRRHAFDAVVNAADPRDLVISVSAKGTTTDVGLSELGGDVVARVATAWILGPDDGDAESALNGFATELLTRGAAGGDETIVRSLASAPRCVSPDGEASVRRALQAIAVQGVGTARHRPLAPLARAVGLGALYPMDGDELGHL
ncbi:MAG TPA: DUF3536 domain-containing protein [Acidimicrobiales bacterium]|nr:DUF3536 domain-containing protein [Acidimicrobiales bacterium]